MIDIRIANFLLAVFIVVFLFLFFSNINYFQLQDPYLYLMEIKRAFSFQDALYYSSNWSEDIGFVLLSLLLNLILNNKNDIGIVISMLISFFMLLSLYKKCGSKVFILLPTLMLFFSFSYLGAVVNVWRQGFAIAFIMMAVSYKKTRLFWLIIACLFHVKTAFIFLAVYLLDLATKKLSLSLKMILLGIMSPIIIIISYLFLSSDLHAYSSELNDNSSILRFVFSFCSFFSVILILWINNKYYLPEVLKLETFRFLLFILIIGLIFIIFIPLGSDRFLHYYFCIFPLFIIDIINSCNSLAKKMIKIFIVFFIVIIFYLTINSSNAQKLYPMFF